MVTRFHDPKKHVFSYLYTSYLVMIVILIITTLVCYIVVRVHNGPKNHVLPPYMFTHYSCSHYYVLLHYVPRLRGAYSLSFMAVVV